MHQKILNFFKKNWLLFLILAIAFFLRILYLIILNPPLTWADSLLYDGSAWNFSQGFGYTLPKGEPFALREPGYPLFFLAPIYFLFGHNILIVQIFQILISLFTIILVYLISLHFLNKKIALLSAFLLGFWPANIAFEGEILTETFFTFLLILAIFFLLKAIKKDSIKRLFFSGLIFGLATLTRFLPIFLPFFLFFAFYLLFKSFKKSLKYSLLIFLAILIFVFPWWLRNYILFDSFVFSRVGSGSIIWSGSYIPWQGEWKGHLTEPLHHLEQEKFVKGNYTLNRIKVDQKLIKLTIKNIKKDPLGVLKIWLKKPYKIFFKAVTYGEISHHKKLAQFLNHHKILDFFIRRGLQFLHLAILGLSFLGLIALFLKKEKLIKIIFLTLIFYFLICYLPLNPDSRYQVPLMPYFIILASVGFWFVFEKIKLSRFIKSYGKISFQNR
jgi:4-amino-4-deoxy-L-arabinose transferase-like glycosyltransferase